MGKLTDSQLAALVRSGDSDAFAELTERYMDVIRAKAAPYHSALLEADDLCQEGLMGLLDAAKTYRDDNERQAAFRTYAGVCVNNRIITAYRWAAGRKNSPLNDFVSLSEEGGDDVLKVQDGSANPEALLMDRENCDVLRQRIRVNLSRLEQQVLMRYLSGYSYQEIAGELGIPSKAADNALQRVRRKLKEPF